MESRPSNLAGSRIDFSEELLRLLRNINEKLEAEKKHSGDDHNEETGSAEKDPALTPVHRWHEATHMGQDYIGE